jgi:hypothetical protein
MSLKRNDVEHTTGPLPVTICQSFQIKIIKEKRSDYLNVLEKIEAVSPLHSPV